MTNEITINIKELTLVDDNSITDCDTIRQIALISCTKNDVPDDVRSKLFMKIKKNSKYMDYIQQIWNFIIFYH